MANIGLIISNSAQQESLRELVEACGYHVSKEHFLESLRDDISPLNDPSADAWIIDISADEPLYESGELALFDSWLGSTEQPIIFSSGSNDKLFDEYDQPAAWVRQLTTKIYRVAGEITKHKASCVPPHSVWVLAASTGGPDAVVRFLKGLPANLGIAFIYAQHIDQFQQKTLLDAINRETEYSAQIPVHGDVLGANSVVIVPVNYTIEFLASGSMVIDKSRVWRGDYKPSIDQVVANVANEFGENSGLIMFTGMGDDGALSSRLMSLQGGTIWIQTPEDCQSPSMPSCCEEAGCASFSGNPEELSENFAKITNHQQWLATLSDQPFADRNSLQ